MKSPMGRQSFVGIDMPSEILQLRESLGMTRAEFAAAIGVQPPTVWRYEMAKVTPSAPVMLRIQELAKGSPPSPRAIPGRHTEARASDAMRDLESFATIDDDDRDALIETAAAINRHFRYRSHTLRSRRFRDRLRAAVDVSGLTRQEICERSGMSNVDLRALLDGLTPPTPSQSRALVAALGLTEQTLLFGLDSTPEPAADAAPRPGAKVRAG